MRRAWAVLAALAWATLANAGKVSKDVAAMPPGAPAPVIVQYTQTPGAAERSQVFGMGGWIRRELPTIRGVAAVVPAGQAQRLAADPRVSYISADRTVRRAMDHTVPAADAAVAMQYGFTGRGVTIAVIDSGIAEHADFREGRGGSRVIYRESFVTGGGTDRYGHGTHVAGIAAGNGRHRRGRCGESLPRPGWSTWWRSSPTAPGPTAP